MTITKLENQEFGFELVTLNYTPEPEATAWYAMHQCYSELDVEIDKLPINHGAALVKNLLDGHKGHFSPLEHNAITFNAVGFPHSLMQQLTRHRVAVSFSVQSMRYSGNRICDVAAMGFDEYDQESDEIAHEIMDSRVCEVIENKQPVERVMYIRPVGKYPSRNGVFNYTQEMRDIDVKSAFDNCQFYYEKIGLGMPYEQARGQLFFDFRQNFVVTFNARSLMHVLDLRSKKDAQLEIQILSNMLFKVFESWMPNIAKWYADTRKGKARLAP